MAAKIRVGIVGATVTPGGSGWGANAHVPALKALPDYELKAVCTAHEDTAQASKEAFGAELAFHNIDDMAAHPDVDLIVVCVRVPWHRDLVMAGLKAGKAVLCEWPLGANLAEAEEMANYAREHGIRTIVGLQGRADPAVRYAHDLLQQGHIGDVLTANLSIQSQAQLERNPGRIWHNVRETGANTLTIPGGHGIDAMCAVLGEFVEITAREATRIKQWKNTETGEMVDVSTPDSISFAGVLDSGVEVSVQVTAVPVGGTGSRLEIYGRDGMMILTSAGALSSGPNRLYVQRGKDAGAEVTIPAEYEVAPEGTPAGAPRNVAGNYARYADAIGSGAPVEADFDLALKRHQLIDAIFRSSDTGQSVKLP